MSCCPSATVVVHLASGDQSDFHTGARSLRATWTNPFDHRLCWAPKSPIFWGNSPTTCGSMRKTPVHPFR